MPSRFFVTGTDTSVGKTIASALLCAALDATYWKPIQTGSSEGTDRRTVTRVAELPRTKVIPEAYCFAPPVSPHLAARRANKRIDIGTIQMPRLPSAENLIVEGAGGVFVPINEKELMTDLMRHLKLPVILVARSSLGTINHTTLSLAALRLARIEVRGVIMVGKPNIENRKAIEHYGRTQVIGTIPFLKRINKAALLRAFKNTFDHQALAK